MIKLLHEMAFFPSTGSGAFSLGTSGKLRELTLIIAIVALRPG
jgi:hypothetical protein